MPSAFTHAFAGAALSTLAPRRFRGAALGVTLAAVAALPDLDAVALHYPYAHPLGHRGFSHSLVFAALVALALTVILCRGKGLASRPAAGLFVVVFLAAASHGVLDAFTDAGLGVGFLLPFDDRRYFAPWRPLRTSPLNPRAFFGPKGLRILHNEVLWVWLPVSIVVAAGWLARRRRPADGSAPRA